MKWKKVEDELPPNSLDTILLYDSDEEIIAGYYWCKTWYYRSGELSNITHWMKAPEKPK